MALYLLSDVCLFKAPGCRCVLARALRSAGELAWCEPGHCVAVLPTEPHPERGANGLAIPCHGSGGAGACPCELAPRCQTRT